MVPFETHRGYSHSEENKYMCTHSKDGAMWLNLYCVFTYIYCLLIKKDLCEHQNVSVNFPYVYLYLSFGNLFYCSVRVSSSHSYFYVICFLILFLSTCPILFNQFSLIHHSRFPSMNICVFLLLCSSLPLFLVSLFL